MTVPVTLPAAYFDAMYQAAADPWGFEEPVRVLERQRLVLRTAFDRRVRHYELIVKDDV